MWTSYWGDEAIAIGIASHSIASLPHYLVDDGAPPLYYVMLHFWMELFGRSEPATHALSMVPAVAAVPVAWWSGLRLFGRWAGRAAAALVATSAYLDYYATETRMYSWLVVAAIGALTCFVLAYRGEGRRYWAGALALMVAVLYLQYYGLYLCAATVLVGAATAYRDGNGARLRATAAYGAACAVAFAPWAPQFLYQLRNTGAPWAPHPSVADFFADTFNAMASAGWAGPLLAIVVAVIATRHWAGTSWWRRDSATRDGATSYSASRDSVPSPALAGGPCHLASKDARGDRGGPPSALALATLVPLTTLVLAWLAGQLVNSWNPRYLGIVVVPGMLALAGGLSRAKRGSLALVIAVTCLAATAVPMLVDRDITVLSAKSDVALLASELRGHLRPGALVISSEVTNTPVIALDLGTEYRYATPLGILKDPVVVNWSDLPARLRRLDVTKVLGPLLAELPSGGQVLLVNPTTWGGSGTPESYEEPVKAAGFAADRLVADDPGLRALRSLGVPRYSNPLYPMTATLFVKIGRASGSTRGPESGPGHR